MAHLQFVGKPKAVSAATFSYPDGVRVALYFAKSMA